LLDYDVEEEIARFKVKKFSGTLNKYHANFRQDYRTQLAPLVVDQLPLLLSAQEAKTPVLVEGANAIMVCELSWCH
jgi:adenylosuccinate synthase